MKKFFFVLGTRPEAIKLSPLILLLKKKKIFKIKILITSQHKQMLTQVLNYFKIKPDYDLNVMKKNQKLEELSIKLLSKITPILKKEKPDCVVVQGDTTSASMGALSAFYNQIDVAHIEAGLRTYDIYQPYPEEMNRKIISSIAKFHFTPTKFAKDNLLKENIDKKYIFNTGNTVIDSLFYVLKDVKKNRKKYIRKFNEILKCNLDKKIIITVTFHRRENLKDGIENICNAILELSKKYKDVYFIIPVHLNPKIKSFFNKIFKNINNVILTNPLNYNIFIYLISRSYLVITDSGGVQEESPYLKKPILIIRNKTERLENLENNTGILCGINKNFLKKNVENLLKNKKFYKKMISSKKLLGNGNACEKIFHNLKKNIYKN